MRYFQTGVSTAAGRAQISFFVAVVIAVFCAAPIAHASCIKPTWLDEYHSLRSSTDMCDDADQSKPLFTREGTLVCNSLDGLELAKGSQSTNWHYTPLAGVPDIPGARPGMSTSPEYFGCRVIADGIAVQISAENFTSADTNIGWLSRQDLQNSKAHQEATHLAATQKSIEASRPRLCYPDNSRYKQDVRGKCFYTDVHPYALVPANN